MKFSDMNLIMRWFGTLYLTACGICLFDGTLFCAEVRRTLRGYRTIRTFSLKTEDDSLDSILKTFFRHKDFFYGPVAVSWYFKNLVSNCIPLKNENEQPDTTGTFLAEYCSDLNLREDECTCHFFKGSFNGKEWLFSQMFKEREIRSIEEELKKLSRPACIAHGLRYFSESAESRVSDSVLLLAITATYTELFILSKGALIYHQLIEPALYGRMNSAVSDWDFIRAVCPVLYDGFLDTDETVQRISIDLTGKGEIKQKYDAAVCNATGILKPGNVYTDEPFYPQEFVIKRSFKMLIISSAAMLLFMSALLLLLKLQLMPLQNRIEKDYEGIRSLKIENERLEHMFSVLEDSLKRMKTEKRKRQAILLNLHNIAEILPAHSRLSGITLRQNGLLNTTVSIAGRSQYREDVVRLISKIKETGGKNVKLISMQSGSIPENDSKRNYGTDYYNFQIEYSR